MYPLRSVHNLHFGDLYEEHEVGYGESLVEALDLLVADLPYNISGICEGKQLNLDKFSVHDMKAMVSYCREVMKRLDDHMFCTSFQFAS